MKLWSLYLLNSLNLKRHQYVYALSVNNIYVMYKMLFEFQISMQLSFKLTHKGAKRFKTNKFSGRRDVTSISFPE